MIVNNRRDWVGKNVAMWEGSLLSAFVVCSRWIQIKKPFYCSSLIHLLLNWIKSGTFFYYLLNLKLSFFWLIVNNIFSFSCATWNVNIVCLDYRAVGKQIFFSPVGEAARHCKWIFKMNKKYWKSINRKWTAASFFRFALFIFGFTTNVAIVHKLVSQIVFMLNNFCIHVLNSCFRVGREKKSVPLNSASHKQRRSSTKDLTLRGRISQHWTQFCL